MPVIVIEPVRLGDETARWIAVGNCLHKTSVLAGLGSIITGSSPTSLCLLFLIKNWFSLQESSVITDPMSTHRWASYPCSVLVSTLPPGSLTLAVNTR